MAASGSGKSSVLRAGVGPHWDTGADVITPGTTPTLDGVVDDTDRLLVVDQFEELFTQVDAPGDRAAFVDALLRFHRPVALALRADFYGSCAAFRELAAEIAGHQLLLGPMVPDELRAAIVEPAAGAGLSLEAGLVELLVAEVEGEPGGATPPVPCPTRHMGTAGEPHAHVGWLSVLWRGAECDRDDGRPRRGLPRTRVVTNWRGRCSSGWSSLAKEWTTPVARLDWTSSRRHPTRVQPSAPFSKPSRQRDW